MSNQEVTVKAYSNVEDYKAVHFETKPVNMNQDLSGYAKVIFLYGQVPELCVGAFDLKSLEGEI